MPRSVQEIIDHAEELAARVEELEPAADGVKNAEVLAELRRAVLDRAAVEARIAELVCSARHEGLSWASIGAMLGTSGEAARQRYAEIASKH